jgi:hypothetical protein
MLSFMNENIGEKGIIQKHQKSHIGVIDVSSAFGQPGAFFEPVGI